jgi:UDP-N-acetylglucosamine:LPS N-acetylglucosamine transferase
MNAVVPYYYHNLDVASPKSDPAYQGTNITGHILLAIGIIVVCGEVILATLLATNTIKIPVKSLSLSRFANVQIYLVGLSGVACIVIGSTLRGSGQVIKKSNIQNFEKQVIESRKNKKGSFFKVEDEAPIKGTVYPSSLPRTLVFSSKGGGGHKIGAERIKKALEGKFFVKVVEIDEDSFLTDWYNNVVKKGHLKTQAFMASQQETARYLGFLKYLEKLMKEHIWAFRPQLVISDQPMGNGYLEAITKKLKVPTIVQAMDFHARHFVYGVSKPGPHFKLALTYDDPDEKKRIALEESQMKVTGCALDLIYQGAQTEILEKTAELKKEYKIGDNELVISICLGSQGSKGIINRLDQILKAKFDRPVTVLCLCANNKESFQKVKSTKIPKGFKVIPKQMIHDRLEMAAHVKLATVYVTKSGGASIAEAVALGVPMLLDAKASKVMPWEKYNLEFAIKKGWGRELNPKTFLEDIQALSADFKPEKDFAGLNFNNNLLKVVNELIQEVNSL